MTAIRVPTQQPEESVQKDAEPSASKTEVIPLIIEFSGGLEILFADQRRIAVSVPAQDAAGKAFTVKALIDYLCEHALRDSRKELFVLDDHLRPGILVLINDADWELEGEEAYEVKPRDNILFVSTLHGG